MNTTKTRNTVTTIAAATGIATTLTLISLVAPAEAHRPAPDAHASSPCVGSAETTRSAPREDPIDIALVVAHRKAALSQYYRDHALRLRDPR